MFRKIFPLCTQLLGTLYAQCTVFKNFEIQKVILKQNVDNTPVVIFILSTYVCIIIIHVDSQLLYACVMC